MQCILLQTLREESSIAVFPKSFSVAPTTIKKKNDPLFWNIISKSEFLCLTGHFSNILPTGLPISQLLAKDQIPDLVPNSRHSWVLLPFPRLIPNHLNMVLIVYSVPNNTSSDVAFSSLTGVRTMPVTATVQMCLYEETFSTNASPWLFMAIFIKWSHSCYWKRFSAS